MRSITGFLLFLGLLLGGMSVCPAGVFAQTVHVSGVLRDSVTREPLPYVSIAVKGSTLGGATDINGSFSFRVRRLGDTLAISSLGYRRKEVVLTRKLPLQALQLELAPTEYALSEVVVKPKKERYSKKDNPAVALARLLIRDRERGDPRKGDYYAYERYEKMLFALNNFNEKKQQQWVFRKFPFLTEYIDTSEITGKPILPFSTKEQIEENYYRSGGKEKRQVVSAVRQAGADDILDEGSMRQYLGEIFQETDIFQNDISLLLNRFVSPLSTLGPTFYKYYLTDTTVVSGDSCTVLGFVPFNTESMGFVGFLYVTTDSTRFIKKAVLRIPNDINLNFVNQLKIEQEFERGPDGTRLLAKDDVAVIVGLSSSGEPLYGRRTNYYRKHAFEPPPESLVFEEKKQLEVNREAYNRSDDFWTERRPVRNEERGGGVTAMLERLRQVPVFYYTEKVISILVSGYIPTAGESKFDLGPMNTTISGNSVEGVRLRAGGYTTANLNPHLFANGYLAYGTKDGRFKYLGELEYSFKPKEYQAQEFPIHSIRGGYRYDVNQLGQHYLYTNKDNVFLALKRKADIRMTYLRTGFLSYLRETPVGFSYGLDLRYNTEYATRWVPFIEHGIRQPSYSMAVAEVKLRYAPNEKYYQTKTKRIHFSRDMPVFNLSHSVGQKGFLGSRFTCNRTDFGVQKRFWFSAFGHLDLLVTASKVWDRVPFPLLAIPNANLSYTIQPESFSLMNAMEFINDQSVSWFMTYKANGLLLNRIPLVKYLKMREVFTFRGVWGSLSDKNDPALRPGGLFRFPDGSHKMRELPYMEVGVGLENIFKILRIDYVWRITYRNNPDIDRSGVRIALEFTF